MVQIQQKLYQTEPCTMVCNVQFLKVSKVKMFTFIMIFKVKITMRGVNNKVNDSSKLLYQTKRINESMNNFVIPIFLITFLISFVIFKRNSTKQQNKKTLPFKPVQRAEHQVPCVQFYCS